MFKRFIYLLLPAALLIFGCSPTSVVVEHELDESSTESDYTLIFYIHGDSDYLYHLADGTSAKADREALRKATNIAEKAESGEVFIYHYQRAKKFLWMIPRRSSELYHYRNGEMVHRVKYRISSDEPFLTTETDLYHSYQTEAADEDHNTYFIYFGHEIPLKNYRGYHNSRPDVELDTESFARGARQFLEDDAQTFKLIILSTCSNGTPFMASRLNGISEYLVASPQNLHLSHMDISSLKLLEEDPHPSAEEVASAIANETFERLTESVQTVISLAVYNLEVVQDYVDNFHRKTLDYHHSVNPNLFRDNIDCAELSFFNAEQFTAGVETLYRPARFGTQSSVENHSGWGCKGQ